MRVLLLTPDVASVSSPPPASNAFSKLLDDVGSALTSATRAENAFASGSGSLQDAVYERARADVAISVATSAAQHTAQSLQSVLNMQI